MGRKRMKQPPLARWSWRGAALGALTLVAVSGGVLWWLSNPSDAAAGPPSLVVDRTVVDLGYMPFGTTAQVAFVLTNAGTGPLKLAEVPRVQALEGC
jgi:hypothetical protein